MQPVEFDDNNFKQVWQETIKSDDIYTYATDHHDDIFNDSRDSVAHIYRLHDVLSYLDRVQAGFNTPGLFFNKPRTMFPLHVDGHNLSTLNVLVHGSPKLWMFVNPANMDIIRQYMAEMVYKPREAGVTECHQFFVHRRFMLDPWKAANKICKFLNKFFLVNFLIQF